MAENKQKKIEFNERGYFKHQIVILIASGIAGYLFSQNFITEVRVNLFALAVIAAISGIFAGFRFGYILNRNAFLVSNMASGTGFGIGIMAESGLGNGIMGGTWFFIVFTINGFMTLAIIFLLRLLSLLGEKNVALKAFAATMILPLIFGGALYVFVVLFQFVMLFLAEHLEKWFGIRSIIYALIMVLGLIGTMVLWLVIVLKSFAIFERIQNKIWYA